MTNHGNRGKRRANPLPSTVRRARQLAGMTQAQAAAVVYTVGPVWLQWESETDRVRRMHPGLFELFLIKTKLQDHPELDPTFED